MTHYLNEKHKGTAKGVPLLPVKLLEKYDGKSNEQDAGKMGEIFEKRMLRN